MLDPEQSGVAKFPFQPALYISHIKPELQAYHAQQYLEGKMSAVMLKQAAAKTENRSADVMSARVPDIWEQWRNHALRLARLKSNLKQAVDLMKATRQPDAIDTPLTGRTSSVAELRAIKELAEQGLKILKVTA